ncbi:MAG: hypothetical protein Q9203_007402 [Teloschistes exilis]
MASGASPANDVEAVIAPDPHKPSPQVWTTLGKEDVASWTNRGVVWFEVEVERKANGDANMRHARVLSAFAGKDKLEYPHLTLKRPLAAFPGTPDFPRFCRLAD